jgi:MoaA/NifB/PqqE/SkfB family radical SAM enzyme
MTPLPATLPGGAGAARQRCPRWDGAVRCADDIMRSQLVFSHLTCNQNCTYCSVRRPADEPAFVRTTAVRARLDAALAQGASEVVLSGGEPAMRSDLALLVAHARRGGARVVVLETNATLIDVRLAGSLAAAGLSLARVNLSGVGPALDAITRDEGGSARTEAGIAALLAANIAVEISAVVIRSTLPLLAALPARLAALGFADRVRRIVVRTPVASPDERELVPYDEAAAAIAALEAAARTVGISVKIAPDSGPPPCTFASPGRVAHIYTMTPGARIRNDHTLLPVCDRCQMRDRCSGLARAYLERLPPPPMVPIAEDRVRRRLSLVSTVEEQVAREFVQPNRAEVSGQGVIEERLIRVNFHCNQSCRFCFVSTHLPAPGDAAVRRAIADAGAAGAKVVLTGGEPTLNANLAAYVRLARESSRHPVHMQSNAIRCSDPAYTAALVEAGLGEVFVSLHGSTAEISDAVTEAPGTFVRTVLGIDNLHAAAVLLVLNFVICERNAADIVPYVRMVAARWPRAKLNVSFVAPSSDVVPKERALIPRYTDVLPRLAEAVAEAARLGLEVIGYESMCGLPLCLVPDELGRFLSLTDLPQGDGNGEFVRGSACASCSLARKCHGLRRGYFDLYGADELRSVGALHDPVPAEGAGSAG